MQLLMRCFQADNGFPYLIGARCGSRRLRNNVIYAAIADYIDGYTSQYSGFLSVYYFFNVIFIYINRAGEADCHSI
jgi:hypothetical protein